MHRFFLPPTAFQDETVEFPVVTSRQIYRVLRLHPGEEVIGLDNLGWQYRLELIDVQAGLTRGKILEKSPAVGEPLVFLNMLLCLTQRDKFEWMLQKCTEVGAASFTPVISSRSLVQDRRSIENKYDRWQRIIQEAAEQSCRGIIPKLDPPTDYHSIISRVPAAGKPRIVAWEGEKSLRLQDALRGVSNGTEIDMLIGPEGGLSIEESELAVNNSCQLFSLGPRILRMETAAVVAAALVVDWFETRVLNQPTGQ